MMSVDSTQLMAAGPRTIVVSPGDSLTAAISQLRDAADRILLQPGDYPDFLDLSTPPATAPYLTPGWTLCGGGAGQVRCTGGAMIGPGSGLGRVEGISFSGGVDVEGGSAVAVTRCHFTSTAQKSALYIHASASPAVTECVFTVTPAMHGAIYAFPFALGTFSSCVLAGPFASPTPLPPPLPPPPPLPAGGEETSSQAPTAAAVPPPDFFAVVNGAGGVWEVLKSAAPPECPAAGMRAEAKAATQLQGCVVVGFTTALFFAGPGPSDVRVSGCVIGPNPGCGVSVGAGATGMELRQCRIVGCGGVHGVAVAVAAGGAPVLDACVVDGTGTVTFREGAAPVLRGTSVNCRIVDARRIAAAARAAAHTDAAAA